MSAATPHSAAVLPCLKCGYELTGLAEDGACPECGASLRWNRELLATMGLERRRRIGFGALLIILSNVPLGVASVWLIVTGGIPLSSESVEASLAGWTDAVIPLVIFAGELLAIPGHFLLTRRENSQLATIYESGWRLWLWITKLVHAGLGASILGAAALLSIWVELPDAVSKLALLLLLGYPVAWLMWVIAITRFNQEIALGQRDKDTVKLAGRLIWQLPVFMLGGIFVPAATLVGIWCCSRVLWRVRIALKNVGEREAA